MQQSRPMQGGSFIFDNNVEKMAIFAPTFLLVIC
jgi:hypothetical protein